MALLDHDFRAWLQMQPQAAQEIERSRALYLAEHANQWRKLAKQLQSKLEAFAQTKAFDQTLGSKEGWKPSDDLDKDFPLGPLSTAQEERTRAKAWMDTAAQHLHNEEYWRERTHRAERALLAVLRSIKGRYDNEDELLRSLGDYEKE